ncbi:MAG: helix-turn-helix domain-containing protein [Cytophagales bacterium]|nr:helix-turn-helix domain-containing protein [Cytophagales bacterium]
MQIHEVVHLIFFAAAAQGIVLSLVFWRSNQAGHAFKLLAVIFGTFALILLHWIAFWQGLYQTGFRSIGLIAGTLDFLLAPMIYCFVKSLQSSTFQFNKKQGWHFLPFLIFFSIALITALTTSETGTSATQNTPIQRWYRLVYLTVENGQFLCYGGWLFLQVLRSEQRLLKTISLLFVLYFCGRLAYSALALTSLITPEIDYVLSVMISASIFSVAYLNQLKPIQLRSRQSYEKSSLSKAHEHLISDEIVDHIVVQRRFLDNDYSIDLLSKELSIPRHHISQALNQHLGKSFSVLINELRVEESMQLLQDPTKHQEKIMGIAIASGFNNKVSFNKYFKQKTGVSPLEFRKRHLEAVEK